MELNWKESKQDNNMTIKVVRIFFNNGNNIELYPNNKEVVIKILNDIDDEDQEMMCIDWVSKNAKFIDFSQAAIDKSNEPDTEPESDTEKEEYECEQCNVEVKTEKDLTITYGCMDMKFCEDCYKTSKEEIDKSNEPDTADDCVCGNNYKKGLVNDEMRCEDCDVGGKNYEGGLTEDDEVCCVGCGEVVCNFNEEPPHKDARDEAVCEECYEEQGDDDDCDEEKTVNDCLHKYECGCDKQTCMEMDGEEWDCTDTLCGNEYCKHYYDKRNDNCNCHGNDCPYCNNEKEDEILYLLKSNCV